jgi:hypothetical protein
LWFILFAAPLPKGRRRFIMEVVHYP